MSYASCPLKRNRRTAAQMDLIRATLLDIVNAGDGMTVRHLFYRMVSAGVIDKTEVAYDGIVVRLALELRRSGEIPHGKILDGSRFYVVPRTYDGVTDALRSTDEHYRRSYWRTANRRLEVWCEKDAVRALIEDVTWELAVPLMATRGFSSESIVQSLAEDAARSGRPTVILSLNDYDPSGSIMLGDIIRRARHYAPEAEFHTQQVALTRKQVTEFGLPTRPTKREGNRHAANFADDESVELDALEPVILQFMLRTAIEQHIDGPKLAAMQAAEESERVLLRDWAAMSETRS